MDMAKADDTGTVHDLQTTLEIRLVMIRLQFASFQSDKGLCGTIILHGRFSMLAFTPSRIISSTVPGAKMSRRNFSSCSAVWSVIDAESSHGTWGCIQQVRKILGPLEILQIVEVCHKGRIVKVLLRG
jgi:hypothetical protein